MAHRGRGGYHYQFPHGSRNRAPNGWNHSDNNNNREEAFMNPGRGGPPGQPGPEQIRSQYFVPAFNGPMRQRKEHAWTNTAQVVGNRPPNGYGYQHQPYPVPQPYYGSPDGPFYYMPKEQAAAAAVAPCAPAFDAEPEMNTPAPQPIGIFEAPRSMSPVVAAVMVEQEMAKVVEKPAYVIRPEEFPPLSETADGRKHKNKAVLSEPKTQAAGNEHQNEATGTEQAQLQPEADFNPMAFCIPNTTEADEIFTLENLKIFNGFLANFHAQRIFAQNMDLNAHVRRLFGTTFPPVSKEEREKWPSRADAWFSTRFDTSKKQGNNKNLNDNKFGLKHLAETLSKPPKGEHLSVGFDFWDLGIDLQHHTRFKTPCWETFKGPLHQGPRHPTDNDDEDIPEYNSVLDVDKVFRRKIKLPRMSIGNMSTDSLFWFFYNFPQDQLQINAASELYRRGWRYHMKCRFWYTDFVNGDDNIKTPEWEFGDFIKFDTKQWKKVAIKKFHLDYCHREGPPRSPKFGYATRPRPWQPKSSNPEAD